MPRIDLHQLPISFRKGSKAALIGHGEEEHQGADPVRPANGSGLCGNEISRKDLTRGEGISSHFVPHM
jgi:hypothetical protein